MKSNPTKTPAEPTSLRLLEQARVDHAKVITAIRGLAGRLTAEYLKSQSP